VSIGVVGASPPRNRPPKNQPLLWTGPHAGSVLGTLTLTGACATRHRASSVMFRPRSGSQLSFDVFAQSFRNGDATPADATAARAVMATARHKHDPQFNSYDVEFADGSHLEMYAGGLDGGEKPFDGAMFALRGVSSSVGDFIFEFTRAANCVLLPAMEPACVLLTHEHQSEHLPRGMSDDFQVMVISSGAELLAALEGGYETWRAYRDQVVQRHPGGTTDGGT
jgi:hypothetical protein